MNPLCCIAPVPFEENQERDRKKDKKLVAAAAPMHDPKAAASSPLELTKRRVSSSDLPPANNGLHKMARDQRSHGIPAGNPKRSHSDKIFSTSSTDGNSERGGGGGENPSPSLCDVSSAAAGGGGKIFTVTPEGGMKTVKNFSGELIQIENAAAAAACGFQGGGLNHVAGILYKWVNLGKGWRPRWCILQEGVFSYYKIHGPDKVTVSHERYKTFRLIGDDAERLMKKHRPHHHTFSDENNSAKVTGEVHLKVSTLRNSQSDDRKFYIFTGTKTLHLRAETSADRSVWMEALQAAKDLFPRNSTLVGVMTPSEEITISTEKLRLKLIELGLTEDAVKECEDVMLAEFSEVKEQLNLMQNRRIYLLDRLRLLEAEKVELETTVVDEMQSQNGGGGIHGLKNYGGSDTESDDDHDKDEGAGAGDGDTDEEDEVFFDTRDSLKSLTSGRYNPPADCVLPEQGEVDMELIGFDYPRVQRRKALPDPKEKEKSVSLWSMIKDNIGKDLTKVCLPVYFNEPISSLQRCFEDVEYSYLLDRAYEYGKRGNNLMRLLCVGAFAVSGYASTEGRTCKPFNPLLGETYEADYPDKGLRFFSEKVSHHPMIVACHCEGRGWKFWGDCNLKSKFWGRSIQVDPVGILTLKFDDGETFQWSKVTTSIYNLILGKLYVDHYGTMRIQGNCELSCKLKFKEQSIIDRNPHQVQGFVHSKTGEKLATLFGKWDEAMYYVMGDLSERHKSYDPMSDAVQLWERADPPQKMTRYGLTAFATTLNELTPGLEVQLPPTDSRLRPDQRHLENGEYDDANAEKLRLEKKQRQARMLQETGWQPKWFRKEKGKDTFEYIGGYWEARKEGHWDNCPDIFGLDVIEPENGTIE